MNNVLAIEAARASIRWIAISTRAPDNRRPVLAWGHYGIWPLPQHREGFLGQTRFNPSRTGGKWACEQRSWRSWLWCRVTHWAEIEGPQ